MVSIGALLNPAGGTPSVAAPSPVSGTIAEVRSFPTSDHGVEHPSGLAWSDAQGSLVIAESKADATVLRAVRPDETGLGGTTVAAADGASLAVDPSDGRVTLLSGDRVVSVPGDTLRREQRRTEGRVVGTVSVQDVQGAAYATSGELVLLTDGGLTRIVDGRVEGEQPVGIPAGHDLRGLATNRQTGDLYTFDATADAVVVLGDDGAPVRTYDTSKLELVDVQGLAFGPSADATDDPAIQSLYIADAGRPSASGMVVEASLDTSAVAAVADVQATLVRKVATSAYNPPSPDPSGIAYLPDTDRLFIDDGEVEEMPIYRGANFWSTTRTGTVVDTGTSLPWSREPTGAGYNPANKHLFVSDDSQREIFEVAAGADGRFGTGDDTNTHFDTAGLGNTDPEGVDYEGPTNSVWIIDGVNREVYRVRAGTDGRFGTSDDVNSHFDVAVFGLTDPEGIAYDSVRDTIVVLDDNSNRFYEFDKAGALLNTIDVTSAGMRNAAGLAIAPSSTGSGARNYFAVARGRDNDNYPDENDGELFELSASLPPIGGGPVNQAPTVSAGADQSVVLPASASLDGTVGDDGLPNPPGATTVAWSQVSGPGVATFANAAAVDTTASFSQAGTYVLRLSANDGALTAADEVTVTVSTSGGGGTTQTVEVRVAAGSDDVEQRLSGGMDLTSSDLELTTDGTTQQVVGLRFPGLAIPAGATVTNAYVQFQVDEVSTGAASLTIRAEAADNAPTYQTTSGNVTSRATTAASVAWSPPDWTTTGQAAAGQRTPNLAALVQAVVGRAGWAQGNALALQVSGTGRRTAEAFEGVPSAAPLLHIEWTTG